MNETKQFFYENQKLLLKLANSEAGRAYLGIKDKDPIIKITPNSVHHIKDVQKDKLVIRADFYAHARFVKLLEPVIAKMEIEHENRKIIDPIEAFLHYSGLQEKRSKYSEIYLAVSDFIPSSGEGGIYVTGSFPGVFTAASGTVNAMDVRCDLFSAYTWRVFLPFDTAALTADAVISAVILRLAYSGGAFANTNSCSVIAVPQTQASNTALVGDDFDQITRTNKGSVTYASFTPDVYNDLTISDLTLVSKTSYTKIALMNSRDFDQVAPTGNNYLNTLDGRAGDFPQVLRVTYTLPANGGIGAMYNTF